MAGFWTDATTEPKRQYRWIVNVGGIPQWIAKKCSKPSYKVGESTHKYINHTFYYPAGVEWSPIDLVLVDAADPDTAKTLEGILQASGYSFPTNPNDVTTISKALAVGALGRVVISQIGAEGGETIEEWELTNAWMSEVNSGELSYDENGLIEIGVKLRFDYAKLIKSGTPVPPANA